MFKKRKKVSKKLLQDVTCTRRLHFCAGHRVYGHEGKCKYLHGHNYVVYIEASAPGLDKIGRVIDFSVLKEKIGTWIDENLDHKFILWSADKEAISAVRKINGQDAIYVMDQNPTAENIGRLLLEIGNDLLKVANVTIDSVVVEETENCKARVSWRK